MSAQVNVRQVTVTQGTVRQGTLADIAALTAESLQSQTGPRWTPEHWRTLLEGTDTAAVFIAEDILTEDFAEEVCEDVSGIAGCVAVRCVADLAELENVAVVAGRRRQGIARRLCDAAIAWAAARGASELRLEVRASNLAALALYRRLGFLHQGVRPRYYSDPSEDAVLMALPLQSRAGPGATV